MSRAANSYLLGQFRLVEPELKGQILPEQSVRETLHLIDTFGWDINGTMVSSLGNHQWLHTN